MPADGSSSPHVQSASQQIDAIITMQCDWRGEKFSHLRAVILAADPAVVEEVKWRKPSRPEGVPVWSDAGIICVADILKAAVRLTFLKGVQVPDPAKLSNARLDSTGVRAIDLCDGAIVDATALKQLVLATVALNMSNGGSRS